MIAAKVEVENITKKDLMDCFEEAVQKGKGNVDLFPDTDDITAMEFAGGWIYAFGDKALENFSKSVCSTLLDKSLADEISALLKVV